MYKVIRKWEKQTDTPWPVITENRKNRHQDFFREHSGFIRQDKYEVDNHVCIREYYFQTENDAINFMNIISDEDSKHPIVASMNKVLKTDPEYTGIITTWDIEENEV